MSAIAILRKRSMLFLHRQKRRGRLVSEGSGTGLIFPVQYATATDCRRISLPLSVSTSTRAR